MKHMNETLWEAEEMIIGALLLNNRLIDLTLLKPEHLTEESRSLFKAIVKCYKTRKAIIAEEIAKTEDMDLYLHCSSVGYSDQTYFEQLQTYVLEKYRKRVIKDNGIKLANGEMEYSEYEKANRELQMLTSTDSIKLDAKMLIDSCTDGKVTIKFGRFVKTQSLLNMKENDFVVLAGATGTGKSGYALNLLNDLSLLYRCLYFNFEMGSEELSHRLLSLNTAIPLRKIENVNLLDPKQQNTLYEAANKLQAQKIEVVNNSMTLDKIKGMIVKRDSKDHLVVFIDHIGLIGVSGKSAYERMTEVAKELRKISLDYNCTIIGLCQLNREASKGVAEPNLSMLRDSGEVEQSASKVLFIWQNDTTITLSRLRRIEVVPKEQFLLGTIKKSKELLNYSLKAERETYDKR